MIDLNMKLQVIKIHEDSIIPTRANLTDAGLDLYTTETIIATSKTRMVKIPTGIKVNIPPGYVGKIEEKSGLSYRTGLKILGGVIDSGYTGEVIVIAEVPARDNYVLDCSEFVNINKGEKIAQLVIYPILLPEIEEVKEFNETPRGENGFGSTGK